MLSDTGWNFNHALYLSVTEVEVDKDQFSITVKVFSDDLYSCMFNRDNSIESTLDMLVQAEVEAYFSDYLRIEEEGDFGTLKLSSFSLEGDSYFLHFNQSRSKSSDHVEIQLAYFYELFPTQRNILKFKNASDQQHRIFRSEDQIETLQLSSSGQ